MQFELEVLPDLPIEYIMEWPFFICSMLSDIPTQRLLARD